jgi:hypothetical protein
MDAGSSRLWYPKPAAGVQVVRSRWVGFLDQLIEAGAQLDEVILSFEAGYSMWAMEDDHPAAIMAHPRWRGINSYEAGELLDISNIREPNHHRDYLLWNAATHRIVDGALQQSIYEPLRDRYPHSRCSNFNSFRVLRRQAIPTAMGGHPQWFESDGFGTHEGPSAYGVLGDAAANGIRRGDEPLGSSPYAAFLYTIKRIESVEASSTRDLKVWVCSRTTPMQRPRPVAGTPYNDEILRHMLVRRHGLLLWNPHTAHNVQEMMQTNAIIEDVAVRIGETGSALPSRTEWSNAIVQSTATGPDRVVHRFTLEFPDQPLRYRLNDAEYVRFAEEGEVGLWVTHAPDDDFELHGEAGSFVVGGLSD